jgi:hypothetical protein
MTTTYRIHPGIGIARLGNSPASFYVGPEAPAALPTECDARGNPLLSSDGTTERTVAKFKDEEGRIRRQAARFSVWAFDDRSPEGRPLKLGDPISGGGNDGVLVDVQWRVWLANKKASWFTFQQQEGEHGYAPGHPRRNAHITNGEARARLMIDPGPRVVNCTTARRARFDRAGGDAYAPTFPPPLKPHSIDTLGELLTDDAGRLLVLGGHGHSGTYRPDEFGQPRIDDYANNDTWFDDTSDGPVMARLVMYSREVDATRFVDVEYPAWVLVGYPSFVPQILDMITMDEVLEDLSIREFATRPDLFGTQGTWNDPPPVDRRDPEALAHWRAGRLQWNPAHRPWFFRDIWPILFRPDEFTYLTDVLGQSNFPHNQSTRGTFDPEKLGTPPRVNWRAVRACERGFIEQHLSGELFVETLRPVLETLEKQAQAELRGVVARTAGRAKRGRSRRMQAPAAVDGLLTDAAANVLQEGVAELSAAVGAPDAAPLLAAAEPAAAGAAAADEDVRDVGTGEGDAFRDYLARWREAAETPAVAEAREALEARIDELFEALPPRAAAAAATDRGGVRPEAPPEAGGRAGAQQVFAHLGARLRMALSEHLGKHQSGRLLEEARARCIAAHTHDPYAAYRQFLFDLLRQPGEENRFFAGGNPDGRTYNLPLMPLLSGDNPISNTLPSKFLRLTDTQYYLLRQWAAGLFYNEKLEGWGDPDPWWPYGGWVNRTAHDLDRAVLTNVLGGAFCPGGEVGWVMRNPSIYREPYRIRADPDFYPFQQTAAQASARGGSVDEMNFTSYISVALSQDNDFDRGLQPGDLTKYMAVPWQADFNECSTQPIDVTYLGWNDLYPDSDNDSRLRRSQRVWETLWWPAHRPMQTYEVTAWKDGKPSAFKWLSWARGIPQTLAGDLKMVYDWWRQGFVVRNPWADPDVRPTTMPPADDPPPYFTVERTDTGTPEGGS